MTLWAVDNNSSTACAKNVPFLFCAVGKLGKGPLSYDATNGDILSVRFIKFCSSQSRLIGSCETAKWSDEIPNTDDFYDRCISAWMSYKRLRACKVKTTSSFGSRDLPHCPLSTLPLLTKRGPLIRKNTILSSQETR